MEQTQNNTGKEKKPFFTARNITWFAVLLALVVLLQYYASSITIGKTSFSLVLIPIVLGGILLGPRVGALLGFVFGVISLLCGGILGMDLFTATLFQNGPLATSLICLGKGTIAGLGAALSYRLLARKNGYVAVFVAAAVAPVLNTGVFILGTLTMLSDVLATNFVEAGSTVIYYLVIGCAGTNFLVEFAINLICAPALYTVINAIERRYR